MSSTSANSSFPLYPVDDGAIASRVNLLALAGADTTLRPVAEGEYAGACPFCGGRDRFRVRPFDAGGGRWSCRHCSGGNDDPGSWPDAIEYAARRENLSYLDACRYLMGPLRLPRRAPQRRPRPDSLLLAPLAPSPAWQAAAREAAARSQQRLLAGAIWLERQQAARPSDSSLLDDAPEAAHAFLWLRQLGLRSATIREAGLGFNPAWEELPSGRWLAPGITIPGRFEDELWYLRVRVNPRYPGDTRRYRQFRGGRPQMLFNLEGLRSHVYGILVADELDALLLQQEAGDIAGVGALPKPGALPRRWRRALGHLRQLFVPAGDSRPSQDEWIAPLPDGPPPGMTLTAYRARGGDLRALVRQALASTPDAETLRSLAGELMAALPGQPPAEPLAAYRELASVAGSYHPSAMPAGRLTLLRVSEDWSEWSLYDEGRYVRLLNATQARAAALGQYDPVLLALGELVDR
jgi:DNA primase